MKELTMSEYCEAVELLLARMDSFPEEFGDNGRWEKLILKYRTYLSATDRLALEDKINALRRDAFHEDVMYELLAKPSEEVTRVVYTGATTIPTGIATAVPLTTGVAYANQCISPNTNAAANINLSDQSIKEIAAQLQQYAASTLKP
jgi:hypothetical protein